MKKTARNITLAIVVIAIAAVAAAYAIVSPYINTKAPEPATIIVTADGAPLAQLSQAEGAGFTSRVERILEWYKVDLSRRVGAYNIAAGESPLDVARKLRSYSQVGLKFTFHNLRTVEQLAEKASERFMMSKEELLNLLQDPAFCDSIGKTPETVAAIFFPDTYEFYYAVKPEKFVAFFARQYAKFWNEERTAKAQSMGLTPEDVSIIASIAEEETAKSDERGTVARLYINRLQCGMKLQADPTVKFAIGDFSLRRITRDHLNVESPYNTYLVKGLPPGPIRLPERATLEAVIDSQPHNYIYMCAREDFSGYHNFTASYSQHLANAARYHRALDQRGVK